jgi:signal transduction histidine kinase
MKQGIDWSQLWYPGPTRVFTPDELARAGGDRPGATLTITVLLNYAFIALVLLQMAPPSATAPLTLVLAGGAALGGQATLRLWRRPSRRALMLWSLGGALALGALSLFAIEWHGLARGSDARGWVIGLLIGLNTMLGLGFWFATVYRAHQIEARLREQAEQARALAMAGQLAAAQIQPHFLYNALASLQHWVQAKDDRAAPMLAALTGFLRATLPLFNRPRLALGDEAAAVREYLEVMRLRLGERLRFSLDIAPAAEPAQVPPGLLLTLVENAVEHGVTPSLHGAEVAVRARAEGALLVIEVQDSGPGLAPGLVLETSDGVGLANTRTRLAQAFGPRATLQLDPAAGGGCLARITAPLETA